MAPETTGESKSEAIAAAKSGDGRGSDARLMAVVSDFAAAGGGGGGTTGATVTVCSAAGAMTGEARGAATTFTGAGGIGTAGLGAGGGGGTTSFTGPGMAGLGETGAAGFAAIAGAVEGGGTALGGTGTAGAAACGAPCATAGAGTAGTGCSEGKRIPQKPMAGSVNSSSTYPVTLRKFFDLMTWQTTSFLVFSLVRKMSWPADKGEARRITAPWLNTRTVLVFSEKGSRLSEPSTVRAPFTVTGISRATG